MDDGRNTQLSLHHVGYAVADIEQAAQSYVRRFGYEVCTPVIHDQTQTAFVQFLRLKSDSVFLELVAPDGPSSKLTRAVRAGESTIFATALNASRRRYPS